MNRLKKGEQSLHVNEDFNSLSIISLPKYKEVYACMKVNLFACYCGTCIVYGLLILCVQAYAKFSLILLDAAYAGFLTSLMTRHQPANGCRCPSITNLIHSDG